MPAVVSPVAGTRVEPKDSYAFIRGTTATFKQTFLSDGLPITVDASTIPTAVIYAPLFLSPSGSPIPDILATLNGSLVPGQQYEYQFQWNVPSNTVPIDEYIISYSGIVGGNLYNFGDEYFTIMAAAGMLGLREPMYATVDDVRKKKFNIDDYLPKIYANDLLSRNNLIEDHLRDATSRLRQELNLNKQKGNSENYRLFCIYYTIWTILLASRGEDGSSVSDQNLMFWRNEYERILAQEKRQSVFQGIPVGRG